MPVNNQNRGIGQSDQSASSWKLDGTGQSGQQRGGNSNGGYSATGEISDSMQQGSTLMASKEVQYGLGGLIDVIKMSDKDLSDLALGVDLLTLGLNLNSQDSLYSIFSSPFTDQPYSVDAQYTIPQCYLMHPPSLKSDHLSKFHLETLFYMFFTSPHDVKQACAAQELYRREWRYHGELRIWLKARRPQELMQGHPSVQFQYFDVNSWEARLFTSSYRGNIVNGLLSEEEVKVHPGKAQQPQQHSKPQPKEGNK